MSVSALTGFIDNKGEIPKGASPPPVPSPVEGGVGTGASCTQCLSLAGSLVVRSVQQAGCSPQLRACRCVSSRSALTCYCRAPSRRLTFADLRWWQEGCSLHFCELWRGRGSPRARSPVLPFPLSAMHPHAVSQQGWCSLPSCELRGGWVSPPSLLCYCYSALLCIASRALRLVLPLLLSLCSSHFPASVTPLEPETASVTSRSNS